MADYKIVITPAAARDLRSLPRDVLKRVDQRIRSLAKNPRPRGCKKLKGMDGLYRVRVGDFRIIYRVDDAELVVTIVRVRDRKDAY